MQVIECLSKAIEFLITFPILDSTVIEKVHLLRC
jgi:hypothetical protein